MIGEHTFVVPHTNGESTHVLPATIGEHTLVVPHTNGPSTQVVPLAIGDTIDVLALKVPTTVNSSFGFVVPIPTSPPLIVSLSASVPSLAVFNVK